MSASSSSIAKQMNRRQMLKKKKLLESCKLLNEIFDRSKTESLIVLFVNRNIKMTAIKNIGFAMNPNVHSSTIYNSQVLEAT